MKRILSSLFLALIASPSFAAVELVAGKVSAALPDASVSTATLASGSVTTPKIAWDAVTSVAIRGGSITTAKLNSDLQALIGSVADAAITTAKLAADSVTNAKLINGAVTSEKLASNAVVTSSCTVIPASTFTQSTFVVAYATVTVTTDGIRPITVSLSGSMSDDAGSREVCSSFLVNGNFASGSGLTSAIGKTCHRVVSTSVTAAAHLGFTHTLDSATGGSIPAAGSNTFAVVFKTDGGTINFPSTINAADTVGQFCVRQN